MSLRPFLSAVFCLASIAVLAAPVNVFAQATKKEAPNQEPPKPDYITVKGTVVEINEKSGRVVSVDILGEGGGDPVTVAITPRIQFAVEGKGDDGFLRERVVVSGTGTLTNNLLFVKDWTVHLGVAARKLRSGVQKADKAIGQSVNSYFLQGPIKSRQQDKDYEEYETLTLTIPALKGQPVYIDKGASVTVRITDASAVEKGAPVELHQKPGRGGRLETIGLKVILEEPLKAEEYFASEDDDKKKKR
ncbi:MAG: hypothetical protein O2820_00440 [Planctomycetota bacterium]|nr:hypothetical protein [Planctomycetota bacterium]MDA1247662.1 hypothetical protein [Planctomycetota bacterium]